LRITRLSKNDFPVRYFPATAITPTFVVIDYRKVFASSDTRYCSKQTLRNNQTYFYRCHSRSDWWQMLVYPPFLRRWIIIVPFYFLT
jgi:hypothetical protein